MNVVGGGGGPPPSDPSSSVPKEHPKIDNLPILLQFIINSWSASQNIEESFITSISDHLLQDLKRAVETGHVQLNPTEKFVLPFYLKQVALIILEKRKCLVNINPYDMNNERFSTSDLGPFTVYIEAKETNITGISDIKIGKLFYEGNIPGIKCIEKRGRNRLAVEFESSNYANSFLNSNIDSINHWKMYIPSHLISCKVIIRNIDKEISEEIIKNNLRSDNEQEVISVRRIKRKVICQDIHNSIQNSHPSSQDNPSSQVRFEDTNSIVAVFRGSSPPKFVKIFFNIRYPELYIGSVIQCHKCCRYGHTSKICKARMRCPACSEEHDLTVCRDKLNPKCIHCEGNHLANEKGTPASKRICEEYAKQKKIKQLMAIYNISVFEAVREMSGNKPKTINRIRDEKEFPSLPNHDNAYGKIPTKLNSYNKAVEMNEKKHFTYTKTIQQKSQRTNSNMQKRRLGVPSDLLFFHDGRLPESYTKRACAVNEAREVNVNQIRQEPCTPMDSVEDDVVTSEFSPFPEQHMQFSSEQLSLPIPQINSIQSIHGLQ